MPQGNPGIHPICLPPLGGALKAPTPLCKDKCKKHLAAEAALESHPTPTEGKAKFSPLVALPPTLAFQRPSLDEISDAKTAVPLRPLPNLPTDNNEPRHFYYHY